MAKAFSLLKFRLCSHPPRVVSAVGGDKPVLIFTDGACENEEDDNYVASVGGVLYLRDRDPVSFGGRLPDALVEQWRRDRKHIIGLVELYAVVLARHLWSKYLSGKKLTYYSRRSAAGSARTKATRCHKRKCRCRSRSNILRQIRPKTLYLAPFLCF